MKRIAFLGTAAFLLAAQIPALADDGPYMIKQARAATGTSIKQNIVNAGNVPLDKTYAELTPEQKASLKAQYEHMSNADEPPYPVRGLRPLYVALARVHESYDLKYKGNLMVYVNIDSGGNVTSISPITSPDEEFTQSVANFMVLQKFKPALCNGTPCAQIFPFHAELIGPDVKIMTSTNPATGISINQANVGTGF